MSHNKAPQASLEPAVRVWKAHDSMGYYPGKMKPEQPGVNGVRYAARTHYLYYTATAKKLFMRIAVDPDSLEAKGEPEVVVAGGMGGDFCIDEAANVIYLATHRQNTIDAVSMDPDLNSALHPERRGRPVHGTLIGPSGGAWGLKPGRQGRTAFFIINGGTASPPASGPQTAKLLRVNFEPIIGLSPEPSHEPGPPRQPRLHVAGREDLDLRRRDGPPAFTKAPFAIRILAVDTTREALIKALPQGASTQAVYILTSFVGLTDHRKNGCGGA